MNILRPVHVHVDYPLTADQLNDYSLSHTTWINNTPSLNIDLSAHGEYGLYHLMSINESLGLYIHRWITHNNIHEFHCDREIIHDIVGDIDPTENVILLFEEVNCYMIYIL